MIEAERKKSEEKTNEQKKSWEEADDRAQGRIVAPEDENTRLTNEAAEREKLDHEREAARKASEAAKAGEQKRWEEEAQAEAKNATSKLEGEILNGRGSPVRQKEGPAVVARNTSTTCQTNPCRSTKPYEPSPLWRKRPSSIRSAIRYHLSRRSLHQLPSEPGRAPWLGAGTTCPEGRGSVMPKAELLFKCLSISYYNKELVQPRPLKSQCCQEVGRIQVPNLATSFLSDGH